jgi:hypothetical protein
VSFVAQDVCAHLYDLHHLECQLNISRQHDTLNTLRSKARVLSETFDRGLHLLNRRTLEACIQVYEDMTEPGTRSYRAQLSNWAPFFFKAPIERFVDDGAIFLDGLELLEWKALELAVLNARISEHLVTLDESCEGTSEPCTGDEAFMSRARSDLELDACENVEVLENVRLAAVAWVKVGSDIASIKQIFGSKWILVMNAQAEEEKATEEWVANVVGRWIILLESLLVRTEIRQSTVPLPLLDGPLAMED